ncbi:hypothetical protein BV22DRAFT_727645 [Leucogyrophana mollusca]|uniref:Uncharacterized protein n=1 Tax=Leucogyrophana mollusca TaxID=85980 RepID=A0ACB8B735_9AGAM|nr:hypothetical protein BV22DRAFT_727645 [Leucogyrophana mollusca]
MVRVFLVRVLFAGTLLPFRVFLPVRSTFFTRVLVLVRRFLFLWFFLLIRALLLTFASVAMLPRISLFVFLIFLLVWFPTWLLVRALLLVRPPTFWVSFFLTRFATPIRLLIGIFLFIWFLPARVFVRVLPVIRILFLRGFFVRRLLFGGIPRNHTKQCIRQTRARILGSPGERMDPAVVNSKELRLLNEAAFRSEERSSSMAIPFPSL